MQGGVKGGRGRGRLLTVVERVDRAWVAGQANANMLSSRQKEIPDSESVSDTDVELAWIQVARGTDKQLLLDQVPVLEAVTLPVRDDGPFLGYVDQRFLSEGGGFQASSSSPIHLRFSLYRPLNRLSWRTFARECVTFLRWRVTI